MKPTAMVRWIGPLGCLAVVTVAGCAVTQTAPVVIDNRPWAKPDVVAAMYEPADPAELAPADSSLFVRVDGLAAWRRSGDADPLVAHAWDLIGDYRPMSVWKSAAKKLGLSEQQMMDAVFGRTVALVGQRLDHRGGMVVMTEPDPAILKKLPAAMGLKPWGEPFPTIGRFSTYYVVDHQHRYLIVLGSRWMFITYTREADFLYRLLAGVPMHRASVGARGVGALTEDVTFNHDLSRLPTDHAALMFTRSRSGAEHHALAVVRKNHDVTVYYAANIPKLDALLGDAPGLEAADFGPLPSSVIMAASLAVIPRDFPGASALDVTLFPHSFAKRVLPRVEPPVLTFLGQVPAKSVQPSPPIDPPVLGLAIHLRDPSVAQDLDRVVKGVHFLLSLGDFQLGKGLFGVQTKQYGRVVYHVADFGDVLASRVDDPQFSQMVKLPSSAGLTHLTFGRIGAWYVICSQEAFFRQWADAERDAQHRLTAAPDWGSFEFADRPRLILSAVTQAPRLASLLKSVSDYWKSLPTHQNTKSTQPVAPVITSLETDTQRLTSPMDEPMLWIADGLRRHHSFNVQMWREGKTGVLGELRVVNEGDNQTAKR